MTLALLCSGQGQLSSGMFDIVTHSEEAQRVITAAGNVLGEDPQHFAKEKSERALTANRESQILCVTRALASAAALEPLPPLIVAGYSVGELAAWGIAGIWSPGDTLKLVARRADLMDKAGGPNDGLGFIRGLAIDTVREIVTTHNCAIAIVNPDDLLMIGGDKNDVQACCSYALEKGALAARPIEVNVASHTPRLIDAVEPFENEIRMSAHARAAQDRTLIGATDAKVITSAMANAKYLAAQIAQTVNWAFALQAVVERGATRILELGPGRALATMVQSRYPHLSTRAVDDFRTMEGVRSWIAN